MAAEDWEYEINQQKIGWDPGQAYPNWALQENYPLSFMLTHPEEIDIPAPTPREAGSAYQFDARLPTSFFNPHGSLAQLDPRRELETGKERGYEGPWTREQWLSTVTPAPDAPTGPRRISPREALWNLNIGRAGATGEGGALRELVPERFKGTGEEGRYASQALQELYPDRASDLLSGLTGTGAGWEGTDLYKGTRWDPEAMEDLTQRLGQGSPTANRFAEAFTPLTEGPGHTMGGDRYRPWGEASYLDAKPFGVPKEWMEPVMKKVGGDEFNIVYPEAKKEYERRFRMDEWDKWARSLEGARKAAERARKRAAEERRRQEMSGSEGGNGADTDSDGGGAADASGQDGGLGSGPGGTGTA